MPKVTILTFHGIGSLPPNIDKSERNVWMDLDEFKRILDVVATKRNVRITFDDGNISDVQLALPALIERELSAEFFLLAGRLDQPGYVGCADMTKLAEAQMTIGSHGMAHRSWKAATNSELNVELIAAREKLQDNVSQEIKNAACPFGAYDRRSLKALKQAGYARVFTSDRGKANEHDWMQSRNTVTRVDNAKSITELIDNDEGMVSKSIRRAVLLAKRLR